MTFTIIHFLCSHSKENYICYDFLRYGVDNESAATAKLSNEEKSSHTSIIDSTNNKNKALTKRVDDFIKSMRTK